MHEGGDDDEEEGAEQAKIRGSFDKKKKTVTFMRSEENQGLKTEIQ